MALQTITLHIPDHVLERAQQTAQVTAQALETILVRELEQAFLPSLPPDEEAELNALQYLSDAALWTIAREQMPHDLQDRQSVLLNGNAQGNLSEAEFNELETLVEQGQKLMLRKGKAAALLTERGHQVTRESLGG